MSGKLALGGLALALFAACGLYLMKERVNRLEGELRHQQAVIAAEQSRVHRLRTEWATVGQPGRIARLAAAHLNLRPARPTQIMTIADLPRREDLRDAEQQHLRALLPSGAEVELRLKPRQLALPLVSMAEAAHRDP
jgi:cell division protein FtsL